MRRPFFLRRPHLQRHEAPELQTSLTRCRWLQQLALLTACCLWGASAFAASSNMGSGTASSNSSSPVAASAERGSAFGRSLERVQSGLEGALAHDLGAGEGPGSSQAANDRAARLEAFDAQLARLRGLSRVRTGSDRRLAEEKVRRLERELRRAMAHGPAPVPAAEGTLVAPLRCADAATLDLGTTALVGPPGRTGDRYDGWLRVKGPGVVSIDTRGSLADTVLEVYDRCDGQSLARDDDGAGVLQSRLVLHLGEREQRFVRVETSIGRRTLVTRGGSGPVLTGSIVTESGDPIPFREVQAYGASGGFVASRFTGSGGTYRFETLPSGRFYVATEDSGDDLLDEVFDDVVCPFSGCIPLDGTPIDLSADGVETANFVLSSGGSIAGRVVDSSTGEPVLDVGVFLRSPSGVQVDAGSVDLAGRFRFPGLAEGSYLLQVFSGTHRDELYDDVPCEGGCALNLGTTVSVAAGQVLTGVDFALDALGSITGRLTLDPTGEAIEGCVDVLTAVGFYVGSTCTNGSGDYRFGGLEGGDYVVRGTALGFQDEYYDDIACDPDCSSDEATVVSVPAFGAVAGIDFALQRYGLIGGRIYDAATDAPVATHEVNLQSGVFYDTVFASSDGTWYAPAVPPAVYTVYTRSITTPFDTYTAQIYDGVQCAYTFVCDTDDGSPIEVSLGVDIGGVDFPLATAGSISGRLVDDQGLPAVGATAVAIGPGGLEADRTEADPQGNYELRVGLGEFQLVFGEEFRSPFVPEVYDDLPCGEFCDASVGDPVAGSPGATTVVDAVLDRRGLLQGTVVSTLSGLPVTATVRLYRADGTFVASRFTEDGSYAFVGFVDGEYRLVAESESLVSEVWDDMPCPATGCDPTVGSPVVLATNQATVADFSLETGATIQGTVADSETPAIFANVFLLDAAGAVLRQVFTGGATFSFPGLASGTYLLGARSTGYRAEIWDDVPCVGSFTSCVGAATSIVVADNDVVERNFVLDAYGVVEGTVMNARTGEPVPFPDLRFVDRATGSTHFTDVSDASGRYRSYPLPPADYGIIADASEMLGELYLGVPCELSCDPSSGTAVPVPLGASVPIDFELVPGPGIDGRVVEQGSGAPLAGVALDFWRNDGSLAATSISGPDGWFHVFGSLSIGFLSTDAPTAHIDEIHDEIQCPGGSAFDGTCDPTLGTLITVPSDENLIVDFELESVGGIFADGFESGDLGAWSSTAP